jgi:predicted dehydrogenase
MAVRFAVIGGGTIGSTHLETIDARSDAETVAICDKDPDTAAEAADSFDAESYTDAEALLDAETVDAVIVAVPPFAHGDVERLVVERGLDLFVEKPLALSEDLPAELEREIADADVLSQVGHMYRYAEAVDQARELVGDRQLAMLSAHWFGDLPPVQWWHEKATSGGQIVEQSTHLFDLCRYVAGDVASVAAMGTQQVHTEELDFEDATSVHMHHESGAVSHVASSSVSPEYDVELTILGEQCKLTIDLIEDTLTGVVDGEQIAYEGANDDYERELAAFIEAAENRDPSRLRSPYADARKTFELTLDADAALAGDEGGTR